jgi:hypothetical protein
MASIADDQGGIHARCSSSHRIRPIAARWSVGLVVTSRLSRRWQPYCGSPQQVAAENETQVTNDLASDEIFTSAQQSLSFFAKTIHVLGKRSSMA